MPRSRLIGCLFLALAAAAAVSALAFGLVLLFAYDIQFKVELSTTPVVRFVVYIVGLAVVCVCSLAMASRSFSSRTPSPGAKG